MRVLLDTNILVRAANGEDKDHSLTMDAVAALQSAGFEPVIARQSIYEFYVVATRPVRQNGMGLPPQEALAEIERIETIFPMLQGLDGIYAAWKKRMSNFHIIGKTAHDARLVAAMQANGVDKTLTFNAIDFRRYQSCGITILDTAKWAQK